LVSLDHCVGALWSLLDAGGCNAHPETSSIAAMIASFERMNIVGLEFVVTGIEVATNQSLMLLSQRVKKLSCHHRTVNGHRSVIVAIDRTLPTASLTGSLQARKSVRLRGVSLIRCRRCFVNIHHSNPPCEYI
jgi:hypothetical protein